MATKKRKLLGYTEFATIAQRNNDGKVKISALNSVNKPIKHGIADDTRLVAKTRVEVTECEDNSIDGDQMYSKVICVKQKDGTGDIEEDGSEKEYDNPDAKDAFTKGERFLKNMVDNILADNRNQWMVIAASIALAALAVGMILFK